MLGGIGGTERSMVVGVAPLSLFCAVIWFPDSRDYYRNLLVALVSNSREQECRDDGYHLDQDVKAYVKVCNGLLIALSSGSGAHGVLVPLFYNHLEAVAEKQARQIGVICLPTKKMTDPTHLVSIGSQDQGSCLKGQGSPR